MKNYTLMFKPEPQGGYTVIVPSLPGCVTYGRSIEEAKTMAQDAITGYLASLQKHHEPIPQDDQNIFFGNVQLNPDATTSHA